MSDENVRARTGYHVYAAHIDIREHGVLLLHEKMDDTEKNDGVTEHIIVYIPYKKQNDANRKKKIEKKNFLPKILLSIKSHGHLKSSN